MKANQIIKMTREEQIYSQGVRYTKETHSPSSVSEFQAAMNIAVIKAFAAGAQWADKTILQEVLEWFDEIITDGDDGCGHSMVYFTAFDYKEELFQSFKERFNIE